MFFNYMDVRTRFYIFLGFLVLFLGLGLWIGSRAVAQDTNNQGNVGFQADSNAEIAAIPPATPPNGAFQSQTGEPLPFDAPELSPLPPEPIPMTSSELETLESLENLTPEERAAREAKMSFANEMNNWHSSIVANYTLNTANMADPFMPIEQVAKPPEIEKGSVEEVAKLPMIQRTALNQFTLSAIIVSKNPDSSSALVESAGVGYLIRKGTKIGPNKGFVKEITDARVVIEETETNYRGEARARIIEFKLNTLDDDPENQLQMDLQ